MKVAVWLMMAAPVLAFAMSGDLDESFFKNARRKGIAEVNAETSRRPRARASR